MTGFFLKIMNHMHQSDPAPNYALEISFKGEGMQASIPSSFVKNRAAATARMLTIQYSGFFAQQLCEVATD